MPIFVIHALNQEPKKASFQQTEITIGRETDNDLVLPSQTVSRHHAVVSKDAKGTWQARSLSETNPLVVDGEMIRGAAVVSEGMEIQVGGDFLLIFALHEKKADSFMGGDKYYRRADCAKCGWAGLVSGVQKRPTCPGCANVDLSFQDAYDRGEASSAAGAGSTDYLDPSQAKAAMAKLKVAKRSHIERIDNKAASASKELSERDRVVLGKSAAAGMKLFGLVFGDGVEIFWDGKRHVAESKLMFPAMKINGQKQKQGQLTHGDEISVGGNRFRYVTK